ncbi:CPBP family intramembrane glutamic endopeptidase [Microbacterium sp.]|uniref:CPBP family intramembrane glutamic endopeptidase n=1 Tax=Microbacterium sp. TaxID=51671 RepID=UPI00261175C3|nr:CPBP family intramembrane glutamic endopeptidase [Microbacterium sp.]
MTDALAAIALTIGVLALFGVSMFVIDLFAKSGLWWARPLVETYAPVVYTVVLVAAMGVFIAIGRLDPLAVLRVHNPLWLLITLLAAPLIALIWYIVELAVASAQVRAAGLLESGAARSATSDLITRPGLWWALAVACAVAEELIFRGMLQHAVVAQWGAVAAIALGALLFGLHHISFGVPSIVSKSVGGALMGLQALLAGSVIPAVLTHLLFQGLVFRRLRRKAVVAHAV